MNSIGLNSYGSILTAQEMRSALLVAVSSDFFAWLEKLASYDSFKQSTLLSERLVDERYDLELVLRFLVLHNRPSEKLTMSALRDFSQLLDDESILIATDYPQGAEILESIFTKTFDVISKYGGEKVFRRWYPNKNEFKGSFLNTSFEVFALGIGFHVASGSAYRTDLLQLVQDFWKGPDIESGYATGRSTEARLSEFVPKGRKVTAETD